MKPERFTKLEIAALALFLVAVLAKPVWSIGAYLFENPANNKSYPNKTNAGFLATTSGTVEVQTMAQPKRGQFLRAGTGTAQGTDTAASAQFGDIYPTDIVGLPTVAFSTSTPAAVATSGAVGTSTLLSRSDHVHEEAPYRFSTSTPVAVGTSGAVGYSQELSRSDHRHAYSDDHMVGAVNGNNYGYLYDILYSSLDSITVAPNLSQSPYRVSVNTTFGTSTPASVGTSGSVGTANTSSRSDHRHAEGTSARTPTAHGSTHNPGGTDVPSAFTNTPGVGKVATLTAAGQNLNGWISTSADPFTNTPGIGKVATLTAAGQNLNGWVTGLLVNTEELTSSSDYWTTTGVGWSSGPSYTFTSKGTRLNVTVEATISPSVDIAGRGFCALTIVADNGATATTQRGKETFLRVISGDVVIDVPTSGYYMVGSLSNHANFTLGSTGQTTVTVRMYQGGAFTRCTVLAGYLKMYVDVYK